MGIRSLIAFPRPTPPAPAKRAARKEKQGVSQISPRWVLGFRFHAPCAAKRPHGPPSFAELLPRGGTEPAPYRPTENLPQQPCPAPPCAQRSVRAVPRNPPVQGVGIQREGPQPPPFGRFEGLGGKSKSLPEFFFGEREGGFFQFGKNPPSQAAELPRHPHPAGTAGHPGPSLGPKAAGLPRHPLANRPAPAAEPQAAGLSRPPGCQPPQTML